MYSDIEVPEVTAEFLMQDYQDNLVSELESDEGRFSLLTHEDANSPTITLVAQKKETKRKEKEKKKKEPVQPLNSNFEIGGNYTHVSIKPHGNRSFQGNLGGVQAKYEYRPKYNFYGAGLLAWREGTAKNDEGKRDFLFIDVQERLGYTASFINDNWMLSLFTGLGYRYTGQTFDPKVGDSLRFRYNEFYFPVGFTTDYQFTPCFNFGVNFTWMPQFFPVVGIVPLKGAYWKLTNTFANYRIELPFDFTLTDNKQFHLTLNPYYEHWQDGHSTAKTTTGIPLGLPANSYNYWGVDLNFSYRF